jgi:hypothetical protein
MAQTVNVVFSTGDRERLLAIASDRSRPLKHVQRHEHLNFHGVCSFLTIQNQHRLRVGFERLLPLAECLLLVVNRALLRRVRLRRRRVLRRIAHFTFRLRYNRAGDQDQKGICAPLFSCLTYALRYCSVPLLHPRNIAEKPRPGLFATGPD